MRNGRTCDVCGELYLAYYPNSCEESDYNGFMLINIDNSGRYYSRNVKDLCPDCKASFEDWLKSKTNMKE